MKVGRRLSPAAIYALEHGVSKRKILRIGYERLQLMSPDARAVMLNGSKLLIPKNDLLRGGLKARGYKTGPRSEEFA